MYIERYGVPRHTFESFIHQPHLPPSRAPNCQTHQYLIKPDSHRRVHTLYTVHSTSYIQVQAHYVACQPRSGSGRPKRRGGATLAGGQAPGTPCSCWALTLLNPLPSTALLQMWVRTWSELPVPSLFRPCGPLVRVQQNGHQSPPKRPKNPSRAHAQWHPYLTQYPVPPVTTTAPKA